MSGVKLLEALLDGVTVEWRPLGEVAEIYGGLTGKNKSDFDEGNAKYITYKNIFSNLEVDFDSLETVKVSASENQNIVKYGDVLFTTSSENAEEAGMSSAITAEFDSPVYLNSFSFGIRFKENACITPQFAKHLFRSTFMRAKIQKTASGVTRFNVSKERFRKIEIPIPCPDNLKKSLKIQAEIVRVLDAFSEVTGEVTANLTSELIARRKQLSHYRDRLLSFEDGEVAWKKLGEVATIGTGSHDTQDALVDGEYIFYARGREPLRLNEFDFDETAIITAGDGAGVGKVFHYAQGKYALHQRAYRIVPGEAMNSRFVYHCIKSHFYAYIQTASVSSSVTSLRRPMFLDFPIPVPSLVNQARIVAILDRFDALIDALSESLSREIDLRRKQYAYYREALLSFPKPEYAEA